MVTTFEGERLLGKPTLFAKVPQGYPEKLFRRECGASSAMPLHTQTNTATIQTIVTRDYSTDSADEPCFGIVFLLDDSF